LKDSVMTSNIEVCRNFRNTGRCRHKDNCKYEHSEGEPIQMPERVIKPRGICHNFSSGAECKFGDKCRFFHGTEQAAAEEAEERKANGGETQQRKPRRRRTRSQRSTGADGATDEVAERVVKPRGVCHNFQSGAECKFGDGCRFFHGTAEDAAHEAEQRQQNGGARKRQPRRRRTRSQRSATGGDDGAGASQPRRRNRSRKTDGGEAKAPRAPKEVQTNADGVEICRNYSKGRCRFGDDCKWAHEGDTQQQEPRRERKPKATGACYKFSEGQCEFGDECRFRHGDHDTRDLAAIREATRKPAGLCNQWRDNGSCAYEDKCRYSHSA